MHSNRYCLLASGIQNRIRCAPWLPEACGLLHEEVQYNVKTGKDPEGLTYRKWEVGKEGNFLRDF